MDEVLVDLLVNNPILWDKNLPSFRNRELKERTWDNIANQLNVNVKDVERRYRTLRERYRRETQRIHQHPGYQPNWNLFKRISFLKDVQSPRRSIASNNFFGQDDFTTASDFIKTELHSNSRSSTEFGGFDETMLSQTPGASATDSIEGLATDGCTGTVTKQETRSPTIGTARRGDQNGILNLISGAKILNGDDTHHDHALDVKIETKKLRRSEDGNPDAIRAFCGYIEATLKRMPEPESEEIIEEISNLIFRKKKQFRANPK